MKKIGSFAAARHSLQQQIDLLTERRQTLITAAVTGQLEIPGAAREHAGSSLTGSAG
jgi:hypothetical protein